MATVGQQLTAPEVGWKRYDNTGSNITYTGTWTNYTGGNYYGGSCLSTPDVNGAAKFNFTGTQLRIIGAYSNNYTTSADLFIDGMKIGIANLYALNTTYQVIEFSVSNLTNKEHYVEVVNNATGGHGGYMQLDAIDIDETGELLPYNPSRKSELVLLRVTMLDSSEREYRLSIKEVEGFVNWYKRTLGTGDSCYELSDIVDNSKEYLAFEKIISFKVIPLNN